MYSKEVLQALKKARVKVGEKVAIERNGELLEGTLMPRIESGSDNALILKLASGYNVGIEFNAILKLEKLKEKKSKPEEFGVKAIEFDENKRTILILHTGGTIASKVDYRTGGVMTSYSPADLLSMFPELNEISNVKAKLLRNMWSEDMNSNHYSLIAREVASAIKEEKVDGIIIGHGTDTLHYTAAALALALENVPIPVILVGAQRSSDRPSTDAALNLLSAAFFICNGNFKGVAVCMHESINDNMCTIHNPLKVRKCHSSRRDAFKTINGKATARVDFENKRIEFIERMSEPSGEFKVLDRFEENVSLLKIHPGFNYKVIEFLQKQGCKGIVFEATGLGQLPINEIDEFTKKNKKLYAALQKFISSGNVIAIATQTIWGRTNLNVYAGGRDLQKIGCISCEDMISETAFIKLSWLLGNFDSQTAKKLMQENLRGEISERTTFEF